MARAGIRRVVAACAACAITSCTGEFTSTAESALTIEAIGWPTEMHRGDVDTVEVRLRLRDSVREITGLRLQWLSNNDEILHVAPLEPDTGGRLEDTLVMQLRAEVTARAPGPAAVSVVVEPGGGFDAADSTFQLPVTVKWIAVSAGKSHTCAIASDSLLYCWGQGDHGQLGNGRVGSSTPVPVLGDFRFIIVSAGDESSCGIVREPLAYCWGSNTEGRLGNGDPSERNQFLPTLVTGPPFRRLDVGRVACGLGQDSVASCWGGNPDGQLGFNPLTVPGLPTCSGNVLCSLVPIRVDTSGIRPNSYSSISIGGHHVCGVTAKPQSGLAFCWGVGTQGALGNASQTTSQTPIAVTSTQTFTVIGAGGDHTCALNSSKLAYCWGADSQLGNGTALGSMVPVSVNAGTFDSLTAGGQHTCALDSIGKVYCWGRGSSGQLGNGSSAWRSAPFPVSSTLRFKAVSAGELHTCAVAMGGSLYCWGAGAGGRLGTGSVANQLGPTRVSEPE